MNSTIIPNIDLTNNLTTTPPLETILISGTAEIALVTIDENNTAIADFDSTLTGSLTFSIADEEDGTFAEDQIFSPSIQLLEYLVLSMPLILKILLILMATISIKLMFK